MRPASRNMHRAACEKPSSLCGRESHLLRLMSVEGVDLETLALSNSSKLDSILEKSRETSEKGWAIHGRRAEHVWIAQAEAKGD